MVNIINWDAYKEAPIEERKKISSCIVSIIDRHNAVEFIEKFFDTETAKDMLSKFSRDLIWKDPVMGLVKVNNKSLAEYVDKEVIS